MHVQHFLSVTHIFIKFAHEDTKEEEKKINFLPKSAIHPTILSIKQRYNSEHIDEKYIHHNIAIPSLCANGNHGTRAQGAEQTLY